MLIEVSDTKLIGIAQACYNLEIDGKERPWIVVMEGGSEYGLTEEEFEIYKDGLIAQKELLELATVPPTDGNSITPGLGIPKYTDSDLDG